MVNEFGCAWILATFGFVQQKKKILLKAKSIVPAFTIIAITTIFKE